MKTLMTAIYSKFTAAPGGIHNALYTAVSGRLYFSLVPQDTAYPCLDYHLISDNYVYTFDENFEEVLVQFDIYSDSNSSSEVTDIFENLKSLYDWCTLTITGYTFLEMFREVSHLEWIPDALIWRYVVQYRIRIQKT